MTERMLYYPQRVSEGRLQHIRETQKNVEEVRLETDDHHVLHGWVIKKDLDHSPTIIYFGGNAEEVSLNIEEFISMLHVNVVLFNYRGYGLSTGSPSEEKLKRDAESIYEYVKELYALQGEEIFVMGRSLGSGIAVHLAVKYGCPKIILVTPYDSIREVAFDYFPKFLVNAFLNDRYETIKVCHELTTSVLLLVAGNDEVIHPKHAEELYRKIQCTKKLVFIEDCGHNDISYNFEYWNEISRYINP